jgi:excisionase family DNA binding protein
MHRTMDAGRNHPAASPIWLTVEQAIGYSGIKRNALYRLIHEGRIRSTKVGERRLIYRESLETLDVMA